MLLYQKITEKLCLIIFKIYNIQMGKIAMEIPMMIVNYVNTMMKMKMKMMKMKMKMMMMMMKMMMMMMMKMKINQKKKKN